MIARGQHSMELEIYNIANGQRRQQPLTKSTVRIGRGLENDVVLHSTMISQENLVLRRQGEGWSLEDVGRNPCQLNGQRVEKKSQLPLRAGDEIVLAEFSLKLVGDAATADVRPRWMERSNAVVRRFHEEFVDRQEKGSKGERWEDERRRAELVALIEQHLARADAEASEDHRALAAAALYERTVQHHVGQRSVESTTDRHTKRVATMEGSIEFDVQRLLRSCEPQTLAVLTNPVRLAETRRDDWIRLEVEKLDRGKIKYLASIYLEEELRALVFGFGPLERLLRRPDVTEIMVVGCERIFIERKGLIEPTGQRFVAEELLVETIRRMVSPLGRRIDKSRPLVDGRLKQGYRVNAVIPPATVGGACLTIRKFPDTPWTVETLIARGMFDARASLFLRAFVRSKKNIVVAGGTGSGKTTLLGVLAEFIDDRERIVTVEDSAELRLNKPHIARLEAVPASLEGQGAVTIRDLVVNALRMRPDRIVVGECRSSEAVDMLQAMNTGHAGSMTTLHSNSAEDALRRLETMVLTVQEIPLRAVREQIASAVDIVVFVSRTADGRRRITQITELLGIDPDTDEYQIADLFTLRGTPADATLQPTGRLPSFTLELIQRGLLDRKALVPC